MALSLLILLSSFIQSLHSCVPTSPGGIPTPIACSQLCPSGSFFTTNPPMMDSNTVSGPCSVRTLSCMIIPPYTNAVITYNGGPTITVTGSGTATLPMTCNTVGTAWIYMGTAITSASCAIF